MKQFCDPAGIQAQDLLSTSQMLLPLSQLHPWTGTEERKTCYKSSIAYRGLSQTTIYSQLRVNYKLELN